MSVLLIIGVQTLIYADSFKHNLVEFVGFASAHNKVNIIISENENNGEFYFFTNEKDKSGERGQYGNLILKFHLIKKYIYDIQLISC